MEKTSNQSNVITEFPSMEQIKAIAEIEPVYYGTKELAAMWHCSIPTVREVMRQKGFPRKIIGGKWLVERLALLQWSSKTTN